MPPAQKFTREEIIAAALTLMRRDGAEGITARGLGLELGTSSRPVFTAFSNMEEVQRETVKAARSLYDAYVERGLSQENPFKGVGMQYIRFAKEEARLFGLLFMTPEKPDIALSDVLPTIDANSDRILAAIRQSYGLSEEQSYRLYQSLWIFTHGIACLCATGVSRLSEEEADRLLTETFTGLMIMLKREGEKDA